MNTQRSHVLCDLDKTVHMSAQRAWWTGQLEAIATESKSYLRQRFPRITDRHDDIVNETQAQLAERISRNADVYPTSWFGSEPPAPDEQAYLFKLARTVLRRRIADHFRDRAAAWAREVNIEDVAEEYLTAASPSHDRRITLLRMLQICVDFIAKLPDEDQLLVSLLTGESDRTAAALTASERQRIHRLRMKLAAEIKLRLGESAASMLSGE